MNRPYFISYFLACSPIILRHIRIETGLKNNNSQVKNKNTSTTTNLQDKSPVKTGSIKKEYPFHSPKPQSYYPQKVEITRTMLKT